jgi:DNA-binding HxlR family transcriptional regulator
MRGRAVRGAGEAAATALPERPTEELRELFRAVERRGIAAAEAIASRSEYPDAPAEEAARWRIAVTRELRGKWSTEILLTLYAYRALRFEELRRQLDGLSGRVLSSRLKMLEARGLLARTVVDDRPPRVEYRLSADGELLVRLGEPARWFLRVRLPAR